MKKKNKVEQQKRYAEKRKNAHEISHTSERTKHNLVQICESSQIEMAQDKSTKNNTQVDNNKCLCKQDITKKKNSKLPKVC